MKVWKHIFFLRLGLVAIYRELKNIGAGAVSDPTIDDPDDFFLDDSGFNDEL